MESIVEAYLKSLSEREYKGYMIAKTHLGSSFDIEKSNSFLEWKETYEKNVGVNKKDE